MEASTIICYMANKMDFTLAWTTQANMPSANKNPRVVKYISKKLQNQQTIGPINYKLYREVIDTNWYSPDAQFIPKIEGTLLSMQWSEQLCMDTVFPFQLQTPSKICIISDSLLVKKACPPALSDLQKHLSVRTISILFSEPAKS